MASLAFGIMTPTAHRIAMERDMQRRQEKRRMQADVNSSLSISSSDKERKSYPSATSPMSPGYNVANVVGAAAIAAVKAVTADKPLKGPDVGPDGNIVVANPFFSEDD